LQAHMADVSYVRLSQSALSLAVAGRRLEC
jgi:hypothetical protein